MSKPSKGAREDGRRLDEKQLLSILLDKELAKFGDSLLNFSYSLALTRRKGRPTGSNVNNKVLSTAAKNVGIRRMLPPRMDRGDIADSVEALIGYAWLNRKVTLDELSSTLEGGIEEPVGAIERLIKTVLKRLSE